MHKRWYRFMLVAVGLVLWAAVVHAAPDAMTACHVAKINAAHTRTACLVRHRVENLGAPSVDTAACEADFDQVIAKADAKAARRAADCRYVDNGDGTISDLNTLLMWEKKDRSNGVHDKDKTYTWEAAALWAQELNSATNGFPLDKSLVIGFAGHADWRLPSIVELLTLLQAPWPFPDAPFYGGWCHSDPCVDPVFNNGTNSFTATCGDNSGFYCGYWSSTRLPPQAPGPPSVFVVNFTFAGYTSLNLGANQPVYVRAVRGGRE